MMCRGHLHWEPSTAPPPTASTMAQTLPVRLLPGSNGSWARALQAGSTWSPELALAWEWVLASPVPELASAFGQVAGLALVSVSELRFG